MYAGHAAIALALKARYPRTPIVPLALACYGPDWVDVALMIPHPREGMAPYSHSIPAVVIGAALAAGCYALFARGPGAWILFVGWLSHWPADLVTGLKPLVGITPLIGLDLYHRAPLDFVLESALVFLACVYYAHVFAPSIRKRTVVWALCLGLILSQCVVDLEISRLDPLRWSPSLALRAWRPHVMTGIEGRRTSRSAWLLLRQHPTFTASGTWRRKDLGGS